MTKIISVFIAIITAVSGYLTSALEGSLVSLVNGAVSVANGSAEFIDELSDRDVSQFDDNTGYIKNILLVFFDEDASLLSKLKIIGRTGGTVVGCLDELCVVRTSGLNYEKLSALSEKINGLDGVALASICPANRVSENYTPNDPFIDTDEYSYTEDWDEANPAGNNWWLEAIDARGAWSYQPYFSQINVGIVDGGFALDHPELEGLISFPNRLCELRNRPDYHGTHVAGIIAAKGDNGVGICGICQNARLTCVDWSAEEGQLWLSDVEIFFGFGYAVKAGAKTINFSIGCSGSIDEDGTAYFPPFTYLDATLYSCYISSLLHKGYDFVVVQSAGNGNEAGRAVDAHENGVFCSITKDNCFIPYSGVTADDLLDRIIIVGNAKRVNGTYYQSNSSNVGDTVDICAPGTSVYSCDTDGGYVYLSGTSMAAPCVTAVAALVWSANTDLTGAEVKEIVCTNTKDTVLPAQENYFLGLNYQSYPLLNAKLAVEAAMKAKGAIEFEVTMGNVYDRTVTLIDSNGKPFVFELDSNGTFSLAMLPGEYTLTYTSTDGTVQNLPVKLG